MNANKIVKKKRKKYNGGNQNCSVPGCKVVRRNFPNVKFHFFPHPGQIIAVEDEFGQPQVVDRRLLWKYKLKMEQVTKWMAVCSLHFIEDDYEQSGWSSVKRLKITSVPSQNLPSSIQILPPKRTSKRRINDRLYNCSKKIYMYKCTLCPRFRTNFMISLKTHIRSGHHNKKSEEDVYKCLKCLFVTHSKYFMVRHCYYNECITKKDDREQLEFAPRPQNKIESSFITYNEKSKKIKSERLVKLKEKPALKKTTKVSWLQCEHCSYKAKTKRNLTSHISSFHKTPENTQWFVCKNCPSKFKRKQDLKRHIFFCRNSEHSYCRPKDIGRFSCDYCSLTFRRNCQLTQHIKLHNFKANSCFEGDQCSYKCKSNERLTSHKNLLHSSLEDNKWFHCKQCLSKFKLKENLKKHTAFFHTKSKLIYRLNCKHCPKKFKQKCNLERHMKLAHHSWSSPKPRK